MKRVWTFLLVVLCSLNIGINVHAADMEKTYMDVSEHLIRAGGRADLSTAETEELLCRVPETTSMLFSMKSMAKGLTIEEHLVQEFSRFSEAIDVSAYGISSIDDMGDIYWATLNEHPELFYVEGSLRVVYDYTGNIYEVYPAYGTYTQEQIDAVYRAMDKPLQMLSEDMTKVEKILFLHDYLCVNVEYSEEDLMSARYHSIEGVALDGMAVCEGYADAFQYFMNELDIPCNIVTNTDHAWNQVQIDGEWYMLDATHDDPIHDQYGRAMHTYFLKSAALMDNRTWVESDFEICSSTRFDTAFWNNTTAQAVYQNGNWYYINTNDMDLYCHEYGVDSLDEPGEVVLVFDEYWPVFDGNGYWVGSYSKLVKVEDKLIYSTPSAIIACDFDGGNKVNMATADTSKGYIYGMRLKNRQIVYQVAQTPNGAVAEEGTFDLLGMKDIKSADIQLSENVFYYTGEKQYPELTIELDGEILEQDKDYSIDYDYPSSGIGAVSVSVTGIGYFKGTLNTSYEIKKVVQQIVCSPDNYEVEYGNDPFNLNASVEGEVLQYTSSDETVVTVDLDGTVSIVGIGTATITITAPGTEYYEPDDKTINIVVRRAQLPEVPAPEENSENTEIPEKSGNTGEAENPEESKKPENTDSHEIPPKNTTLQDENGTAQYVVTKAGAAGGTVTYKKNLNTRKSTVVIPGTVKIDGITYKVTAIAKGAFKNNKMKKVTIPSGVTTIGDEAFSGCKKLTGVTIPSKVKKIGKKAFYKCSKLKNITIKTKKLKKNSIGSKAFNGIHKKATIKVPKKCFRNYKKWLNKAGVGSKATIKKQ